MNKYDAIVIGSGISGGWAAKELTEKGLGVLMLERGHPYEHIRDYKTASLDPWQFEHRGKVTQEQKKEHPYIARTWGATEAVIDSWAKGIDCPYTEVKPFNWWRSYRVGGRSTLWGRQSYRWSDHYFEANGREGWAIDWPIRYNDLEPWYDHVERFIGVSGSREGLP
ncbi:MAG TPA: GMC family oxidoreductase, partial [Puia sp.]|nr:GMC family oxidoreductase [Puia sp.]